jgi:alpha-galactosidase
VARRFHRHLRARPRPVGPNRPVTLNVWEAVYFDHDTERLLDLAERAAALGVERYVLDDGWFSSRRDDRSGLGDWVVSDEVWPHGLHPLVDRVKKLGMQFGLWFEPEMVNPDSDLARAHPEWIMAARTARPVGRSTDAGWR